MNHWCPNQIRRISSLFRPVYPNMVVLWGRHFIGHAPSCFVKLVCWIGRFVLAELRENKDIASWPTFFGSMLSASAWILSPGFRLSPPRPRATLTFRLFRCCVRWAPVAWHWSTPPRSSAMTRRWWSELCSALAWRWSLPLPGVVRALQFPLALVRGRDASKAWPGCVVCVALFRRQWARMDAQYSCLP